MQVAKSNTSPIMLDPTEDARRSDSRRTISRPFHHSCNSL